MRCFFILCLVASSLLAQTKPYSGVAYFNETKQERTQWFQQAKLGLFIHWGLYSAAGGYWQQKKYKQHYAEWIQYWAKVPTSEYAKVLKPKFTAAKYKPKYWAKLAKKAGMQYAVLTTKHHEGFTLFNSKTNYSLSNTISQGTNISPKGRDLVGEYIDAFRKEGLHPGVYYSLIDWQHPKAPPYNRLNGNLNNTDYSDYISYLHAHVNELMTNYGNVDVLWVDYSSTRFHDETWKTRELLEMVAKKQPNIIVNNRFWKGIENPYGDFITPEKFVPATGYKDALWEVCHTMNESFGYSAHDEKWKSLVDVIHLLIDTNSKGGNLLLNIGPDGEGVIPKPAIEILEGMGDWMQKYSSTIYGTEASVFETLEFDGKSNTKYLTETKTRLHFFVYQTQENNSIEIKGLKNNILKVIEVDGKELKYTHQDGNLVVYLPNQKMPKTGWVVAVDIKGKPDVEKLPYVVQRSDRKIIIKAKDFKLSDGIICLEKMNLGCWTNMETRVSADFLIKQIGEKQHHGGFVSETTGNYKVVIEYAVAPDHGGEFEMEILGKKIRGNVTSTGAWSMYKKKKIGVISISEKGLKTLSIQPASINKALMNLKSVELIPIKTKNQGF